MSAATPEEPANGIQDYALIVRQQGKPQQFLTRYLTLLLNYRYGLEAIVADRPGEGVNLLRQHRNRIRCAFFIHNQRFDSKRLVASLNLDGAIPLFLLLPRILVEGHRILYKGMPNVFFCSWENAFGQKGLTLHKAITVVFSKEGVGNLGEEVENLPLAASGQVLEHRLQHLRTLPTIPELALRIMRMTEDPQATVEDMEQLVTRDPAIVFKLIQVVNSPVFAGTVQRTNWPLKEALVRLGRKQVGAIALQIKLMNSLIKPGDSQFDMIRFWRHSVGCAVIADRIYKNGMIQLPEEIPFDDYWIGSLLHDIGKLVLGFFFWNQFEDVVKKMDSDQLTFREAERGLGDLVNHEYLGRLLLQRSKASDQLVEVVGTHDTPGETPTPLVCLVHLATNLSNELGLSYMPQEKTDYSAAVMQQLGIDPSGIARQAESFSEQAIKEIDELVEGCLH
jgi:HD-like signal output (HDOD) protein